MMRHLLILAALNSGCALSSGVTPSVQIIGNHISCPNASDASSFTLGDYQSYTCTWNCADYAGNKRVYVQLTYVWNGTAWRLDSTFTAAGVCGGSYDARRTRNDSASHQGRSSPYGPSI